MIYLARVSAYFFKFLFCTSVTAFSGTSFLLTVKCICSFIAASCRALALSRVTTHTVSVKYVSLSHVHEALYGASDCTFCLDSNFFESSVFLRAVNLWVDSESVRFTIHRLSIRFKNDFCKFRTIQFTIKFDSIRLTIRLCIL